MTALTVPEVLRAAERILGERGHNKRDYINDSGQVCVRGAINLVILGRVDDEDSPPDLVPLQMKVLDALAQEIGCSDDPNPAEVIVDWNDASARTAAEVRAALLAAADRAEANQT